MMATGGGDRVTEEQARRRWPGESLYQCNKCGDTRAGNGPPPAGRNVHFGCGGEIVAVPGTSS